VTTGIRLYTALAWASAQHHSVEVVGGILAAVIFVLAAGIMLASVIFHVGAFFGTCIGAVARETRAVSRRWDRYRYRAIFGTGPVE